MIDPNPEAAGAQAPFNRLPPDDPRFDGANSEEHASPPHGSAAELFAPLLAHFQELLEYAAHYISARADLVRSKVRTLVLYAVLGVVAGVVLLTTLIVVVVMVLSGIAGGLGELLGNRPWAGSLLTGCIVLAIGLGSLQLAVPQWLAASRKKVKEKYDRRRQTQRTRFGHDIDEVRKN